jgi:hypothetical protein
MIRFIRPSQSSSSTVQFFLRAKKQIDDGWRRSMNDDVSFILIAPHLSVVGGGNFLKRWLLLQYTRRLTNKDTLLRSIARNNKSTEERVVVLSEESHRITNTSKKTDRVASSFPCRHSAGNRDFDHDNITEQESKTGHCDAVASGQCLGAAID